MLPYPLSAEILKPHGSYASFRGVMKRRVLIVALIGYNLLLGSAMLSLVPPPLRTLSFADGEFGPVRALDTLYYRVSKPFLLKQGESLRIFSFVLYTLETNNSAPKAVSRDILWIGSNASQGITLQDYVSEVTPFVSPRTATYFIIVGLLDVCRECVHISGTLEATARSGLPGLAVGFALVGLPLISAPLIAWALAHTSRARAAEKEPTGDEV